MFRSTLLGIIGLTDDTLLTATKNLENIAGIEVNGGTTPYLGVFAIAATEDVQGLTQHVHTLASEDDARPTFKDMEVLLILRQQVVQTTLSVKDCLSQFVFSNPIEEDVRIHKGIINIDFHTAVHNAAVVASAIHITTL